MNSQTYYVGPISHWSNHISDDSSVSRPAGWRILEDHIIYKCQSKFSFWLKYKDIKENIKKKTKKTKAAACLFEAI